MDTKMQNDYSIFISISLDMPKLRDLIRLSGVHKQAAIA